MIQFDAPSDYWRRAYYGSGHDRVSQMDALRGLCRAKGMIDMWDRITRVGRFNLNQKKTTGSVQDIPFTVVGTKTT